MNIVEAYIKFKNQLIIFISGLPACGKLKLAKKVKRDFNLKLLNQFDYYRKDYNVKTTLQDGTILINWYTDSAIDWTKLNEDIDKYKKDGVIVVGFSLPEDKFDKKDIDFHLHLNIPKQLCMEKRKDFVEKNKDKDKYKEEFSLIGTVTEKLRMNQLIFPYYLESMKKSKINKFINIATMSDDEVYDTAFKYLIDFIEDYLYPEDTASNSNTPKVTKIKKNINIKTESSSLSFSGELLNRPKYSYDKDPDMITELTDKSDVDVDIGDGPIKFIPIDELQEELENVEEMEVEDYEYQENQDNQNNQLNSE